MAAASAAKAAGGGSLTVYSSLPLQGASKNQAEAIRNGMKLALEQASGRVGDYKIKYTSLDDSTAQAGAWTPEATSANARKAAQDDSTIAYLGEFNSGASAVSIPILNETGVPQNGLTNTAVGLTTDAAGSEPGEPDKYYPSGERNYVRIVPKDDIQGAALVTMMKQDGCSKVFMTNDKEVFGAGLARNIELNAKEQGVDVIANEGIDKNAANYRSLASSATGKGADCMVYAGITANNAVQLFKDFSAAMPDGKLYGPDGIAESGFADPEEGRHPGRRRLEGQGLDRRPAAGRVRPGGPEVLQGLRGRVRRQVARPLRDLRLRVDEPDARRDQARRGGGQGRQAGRDRPAVRDQGPLQRPRQLLDRRERRHDAHRLRLVPHRQGPARLRRDRQG